MHGQQPGELAKASSSAGTVVTPGKEAVSAVDTAEARRRSGGTAHGISLLTSARWPCPLDAAAIGRASRETGCGRLDFA